jgi:hypothetical protein
MALKILLLFLILVLLVTAGNLILKKQIREYNPFAWSLVELFWYMISFAAVCLGLIEIDRIERLNNYQEKEQKLIEEYRGARGLLYAQTRLLTLEDKISKEQKEGVDWFFKMYALLEEGLYAQRWESFLKYTRSWLLKEPGIYADPRTSAMEFNWPSGRQVDPDKMYLKEEIRWVVENLKKLQEMKSKVGAMKPVENTNYIVRYVLIILYLLGLSLKLLKIRADYKKARLK